MIDFYALTSPNVQKIFIMLEECGLPYNIKPVDVWAGEQFTPEFAKINPLLKVPAIVDSDGPGGKPYTVIKFWRDPDLSRREDRQIHPARAGCALRHPAVARVLQVANVGPMSGQHVHFSKFAGPGHDYSAKRYRTQVINCSISTKSGWPRGLTSPAANTRSPTSRPGPGCAISSCSRSILPNIRRSRPGPTRSPGGTRSNARSHISPRLNRSATRRATTRRIASLAAGNTRGRKVPSSALAELDLHLFSLWKARLIMPRL